MELLESSEISADNIRIVSLQGYQFLNGLVHLLAYFSSANPFQDTFHYIQKQQKKANVRKEECIPSDCLYWVLRVVSFHIRLYRDKISILLYYSTACMISEYHMGFQLHLFPFHTLRSGTDIKELYCFLLHTGTNCQVQQIYQKSLCPSTYCYNVGIKILVLKSNSGSYKYL